MQQAEADAVADAALAWGEGSGGSSVGACTLLGPEGPGAGILFSVSSWAHSRCRLLLVGGVGTARTLRTTQWTRASLNRPSGWFGKDDLKDH